MNKIIIVPYDENWKTAFERIKEELLSVLHNHVMAIEHVGSTSVEGLAAKPIIDIDIIIKDYNSFETVKEKLSQIGYTHDGEVGIKDRHSFVYKIDEKPHLMNHHTYVCPEYSEELNRHIVFRDYLRSHPQDRDWYGSVKMFAAKYFSDDRQKYLIAKTPCVREIFIKCGL